jgi:hypothetical protein
MFTKKSGSLTEKSKHTIKKCPSLTTGRIILCGRQGQGLGSSNVARVTQKLVMLSSFTFNVSVLRYYPD